MEETNGSSRKLSMQRAQGRTLAQNKFQDSSMYEGSSEGDGIKNIVASSKERQLKASKLGDKKKAQKEAQKEAKVLVEKKIKKLSKKLASNAASKGAASTGIGFIATYIIWTLQLLFPQAFGELELYEKILWLVVSVLLLIIFLVIVFILSILVYPIVDKDGAIKFFGKLLIDMFR